ncbi:MAG: hypothetical protein Fur0032_20830 [Terrimicrobiaceae bacterium]
MIPAISVLMPCYNAGPFLAASIASIVRQSFRDWEMLIVDDASTDGSLEIARDWARKDTRIRVLENASNKGQTRCLNQGLRECRGRWVARQDADDLSHPFRLARQFEILSSKQNIVLLGTAGRMIDSRNRLVGLLDVPNSPPCIRLAMRFLNPILHTAAAFDRSLVLTEFGGYDESFHIAQDYDLWQRIVEKYQAANLSARLVSYRHLPASLSKAGSSTAFEEASRVAARLCGQISPQMVTALTSLREGRPPENLRDTEAALAHISKSLPAGEQQEWKNYSTRLLLRACGSGGPSAKMQGLALALHRNPWDTLQWLLERFL